MLTASGSFPLFLPCFRVTEGKSGCPAPTLSYAPTHYLFHAFWFIRKKMYFFAQVNKDVRPWCHGRLGEYRTDLITALHCTRSHNTTLFSCIGESELLRKVSTLLDGMSSKLGYLDTFKICKNQKLQNYICWESGYVLHWAPVCVFHVFVEVEWRAWGVSTAHHGHSFCKHKVEYCALPVHRGSLIFTYNCES